MEDYLRIVEKILDEGYRKENRTGVDAFTIAGEKFEHDMEDGFPLLTTKKMATKVIRVELEGFIKGITDKKWYQERGCHIWDEWCNPRIVPYVPLTEEIKKATKKMFAETDLKRDPFPKLFEWVLKEPRLLERHAASMEEKEAILDFLMLRHAAFQERDLGPIYGFQWRHFGAEYKGHDVDYTGEGVDQLAQLVDKLHNDSSDRRMIVSAWNPGALSKMALPPCHYSFQVTVIGDELNLLWNQRSVDTMLGLPFNIASYGFLLHLLAEESGFNEGKLIGSLMDTHIYENQVEGAEKQLLREPMTLPYVETPDFTSIFDWEHQQTKIKDYKSHPRIKFEIAV